MTTNQKAIRRLYLNDILAMESSGKVYVSIMDTCLELSQDEINYQAERYDEEQEQNLVKDTNT